MSVLFFQTKFFFKIRSPQDSRLYIVKDDVQQQNISEPISAFDQLNLFDNSSDVIKRVVSRKDVLCFFLIILFFVEGK